MRLFPSRGAAILAVAVLGSLVSTNASAQDVRSNNPVVQAVKKTIAGVVAIRVPRAGESDMIGSGTIVDECGLIITNYHVTTGKRYVKVHLNDSTNLDGEVVVADERQDLAVIRIRTDKKLQALALAPTSDLLLAETVIAIGSPYGYDGTVSVGYISALNRKILMPNEVTMTGLIQTTAPINPGNSGGPLININGEVIGVNVALREKAQNIAFAINASTVKTFLNYHFNAKRVAGIDHGVRFEEKVVAEMGDRQRIVVKNTAHDALKTGDEILTVAAMKVANAFDMERSLWNTKPGQKVEMKVNRQGHEMTVQVILAGVNQGAGQVAAVSTETILAHSQTAASNVRSANQR